MGSSIQTSRLTVMSVLFFISFQLFAQETIEGQYQQFYDKAATWQDYKMIKMPGLNDFWQVVSDTLAMRQQKIDGAQLEIATLNGEISNLSAKLGETESALASSNELNDSIAFFGIQMSKTLYNLVLWSIIAGLGVAAVSAFLMFKRSNAVTQETRDAFTKLEAQFDEHREKSRESQVKLKRELQTALNALQEQKVR